MDIYAWISMHGYLFMDINAWIYIYMHGYIYAWMSISMHGYLCMVIYVWISMHGNPCWLGFMAWARLVPLPCPFKGSKIESPRAQSGPCIPWNSLVVPSGPLVGPSGSSLGTHLRIFRPKSMGRHGSKIKVSRSLKS